VYTGILPKVEEERLKSAQVEEGNKPTESEIDDGFLSCIEERRELFEYLVHSGYRLADERYSDHLAYHSLPPEEVMDKVLRYETRVQKLIGLICWQRFPPWLCPIRVPRGSRRSRAF
jgi:hypothetical protein